MTRMSEYNNDFTRKEIGLKDRAARPVAAVVAGSHCAPNSVKPVPFNGLLTNKLLTALPGEDFARLLPHLEPVSLSGGNDLYGFEEDMEEVYFPEGVVLAHLHILADGSTTEASMIGKEGMTGLAAIFAAPTPTHWTQVVIPGTALRVRAQVLRDEFVRGGALQRLLLAYASVRIEQLSQRAICNVRHTVEERLCNWLLMIHDRVGDDQLPLTHEKIARHLGARRAGITEAINALREQQIVTSSRGQLRITDRPGLELATCECYRTLSQQKLTPAQL
jgi:CRP-like cAMP-binding protein